MTTVQPVPPSGTVTFLFTDVVDSTRLWERDQLLMADALARHDEILRSTIEAHGGYVFSTAGDAFAAAFNDPAAGLEVAVAVRDALEEEDWDEQCRVTVRAGLHTGTAVERDGDYFGPTLNRCARVMSIGGGGDILLSAAIAELLDGAELVDLGMLTLRGIADTVRVFGVPRRDGEVPHIRNVPAVGPVHWELVGRERDLAGLRRQVREHRLVSLVGPGGAGKTALAAQLLAEIGDEFDDGAMWCDLAPVDAGAVLAAVAASIGLLTHDPEAGQVAGSLRHRHVLIVLDNCEHVIETVADLVLQIVAGCPMVTVLCTSREALRVRDEVVASIRPLSTSATVELFMSQAAETSPGESLSEELVWEICERLDGLPLAVELAVSRLTTMTAVDVADRLSDRFRVLRSSARDVVDRQRTLRDNIGWSYDLLNPPAREVFGACAVFVDGFSLESAQRLCSSLDLDEYEVEDAIEALTAASLVSMNPGCDSRSRYRMLESIREFALAQPQSIGRRDLLADWFVDVMVEVCEAIGAQLLSPEERLGRKRFSEELANARAAARHALAVDAGPDRVFRLAEPLTGSGLAFSFVEPVEWLSDAIDRWANVEHPRAASAHLIVGMGAALRGDKERARFVIEHGQRLAARPGSQRSNYGTLMPVAYLEWVSSNYREAIGLARQAVEDERRSGSRAALASALAVLLNWVGSDMSDFDAIRAESLDVATTTGVPSLIAQHHGTAGIALSLGKRVDEAVQELGKTLRIADEIDSPELAGLAHRQLLLVRTILDDPPAAAFHGRRALENFLSTGFDYTAWVTIRWATITMANAGFAWEAVALDAACSQSTIASRRFARERELWEPPYQTAAASLSNPDTAIRDGQALTDPETFALALATLDKIQHESQSTPSRSEL